MGFYIVSAEVASFLPLPEEETTYVIHDHLSVSV